MADNSVKGALTVHLPTLEKKVFQLSIYFSYPYIFVPLSRVIKIYSYPLPIKNVSIPILHIAFARAWGVNFSIKDIAK